MNIEKYLVLNRYLLSLFGVSDIKDLLDELKNKSEGVDSDGRTYFVNALRGIKGLKIPEDVLLRYDENIQSSVKKINYRRAPVSLKYFQYLAVLFTEIFLDNLKNRKIEFLYELNEFLRDYSKEQDIQLEQVTERDLNKIAFWMATGSGKTLIMHINYYQFFHYNLFSPDNILLITPNEGLSKQHFEELQRSGIPCQLYAGSPGAGSRRKDEVLVIEMTKFVEEKRGGGVTLPVEAFEGKNLIFVDEGHKGKKSEEQRWAKLRNKLAENGFVFEYSATFGQILSEKAKEILEEYAKSIVFDYSYKYFYLDGYGKDFSVVNVRQTKFSAQEFAAGMFVANLLSFYEQLLVYEENKNLAKEYNLEKPLWIFVGTTVTGMEEESDVIQIVEFINRVISDEEWVKKWLSDILNGNTNLKDDEGNDIFQDRFKHLREKRFHLEDLYRRVFGGKGGFKLYEIKNAQGEIGLKVGENEYFGVINIGDVSGFKKQLEKKRLPVEQDALSNSLFDTIKVAESKINILIGSKKFIEGWDTWRVSSMGLLNIGKGQGPQIIQLFGRGVRLKGKGMSLKRSGENSEVRLLERLNIYGIKADYLNKFLEAIRKEEVEFETIEIPVKEQHKGKWEHLYTLKPSEKRFEEEEILRLEIDNKIYYTVERLPKLSVYLGEERKKGGIKAKSITPVFEGRRFQEDIIDLLDWEGIWKETEEFKMQRNYWNLIFDQEMLRNILLSDRYTIQAPPEIFEKVNNREDIKQLEEIAILVIKKYLDLFYRKSERRFETENLRYYKLERPLFPLISEGKTGYIVQIDKKKKDLINRIRKLARDLERLIKEENGNLPRVYFENSLYLPLLIKNEKIDKISPEGLVKSEQKFVKDLREYLKNQKFPFEVYLLRNYPFSGVGFQLEWSRFYPDFIMWVKRGKRQTIVFIDPKGLEHSKGLDNEKIKFSKNEIRDLERKLGRDDIALAAFILSITPYSKIIEGISKPRDKEDDKEEKKEDYEAANVLFLDDADWPKKLFQALGDLTD